MSTCTTPRTQPADTIIHPDFMHYIAVDDKGVKAFLRAIAVNAVGQAITLAAVGIKVKSMSMPNMSGKARCRWVLPKGAWVTDLTCVRNEGVRRTRFLEATCLQISGAVAEFLFDESDHYGNLGFEDIEGSYDFLSAYESRYHVEHDQPS